MEKDETRFITQTALVHLVGEITQDAENMMMPWWIYIIRDVAYLTWLGDWYGSVPYAGGFSMRFKRKVAYIYTQLRLKDA
jgi:hypothetical protein